MLEDYTELCPILLHLGTQIRRLFLKHDVYKKEHQRFKTFSIHFLVFYLIVFFLSLFDWMKYIKNFLQFDIYRKYSSLTETPVVLAG